MSHNVVTHDVNRDISTAYCRPSGQEVVREAAGIETKWTSIRGRLQQHQTSTQKAAQNLRFAEDPQGRRSVKTYCVMR